MDGRRVVTTLSIGDRPWVGVSAQTLSRYAKRHNADFVLFNQEPSMAEFDFPEPRSAKGRPNKRVYACKAFIIWKLLQSGYSQVLFLDDTCLVRADTPDLFDLAAPGTVTGVMTGRWHAEQTFRDIASFTDARGLAPPLFDIHQYINSGVVVYDTASLDVLAPDRVIAAASLLQSGVPHQTLLYYLVKLGGLSFHTIPKKYNTVPGVQLPKDVRRDLTDITPYLAEDYIYHITGMYRRRDLLIPQVARYFEQKELLATSC